MILSNPLTAVVGGAGESSADEGRGEGGRTVGEGGVELGCTAAFGGERDGEGGA
jgi:hypothetical protein